MLSLFQPVAVLTGHHYVGFNHSFTLYSEVAGSLLFENKEEFCRLDIVVVDVNVVGRTTFLKYR